MATGAEQHGNRATEAGSRPAAQRPPRGLMVAVLALVVWLAVPWALILATTVEGEVVFAVCLLFSLIAFGVAGITVVQALRSWPGLRRGPDARGLRTGAERELATQSGRLPMKAAAVQILLIPAALALGFTLLALVDVAVRT